MILHYIGAAAFLIGIAIWFGALVRMGRGPKVNPWNLREKDPENERDLR
jgi:hypothetical protein